LKTVLRSNCIPIFSATPRFCRARIFPRKAAVCLPRKRQREAHEILIRHQLGQKIDPLRAKRQPIESISWVARLLLLMSFG